MTPRLILEVLDGRDAVRARARIDTLPATVGRGYANDLILDDPYVCPTHVRISETDSGELVAEDVGSVNGLYVARDSERVARVILRHGMELRIGRGIVRCAYPHQSVAATLIERRHAAPSDGWLGSAAVRAVVLLGMVALMLLTTYAGSEERNGATDAVSTTIGVMILLSLWAGAWALASRVVSHRFAFTRHLAFASLVAAAVTAYGTLIEWITFFVPAGSLSTLLAIPAGIAAAALLVNGHLGIASAMPRAQRLRTAFGITGGLTVIMMLFSVIDSQKFTTKLTYEGQLKPVPVALVPTTSIDRFITAASSLRDDVDRMAPDSTGGEER